MSNQNYSNHRKFYPLYHFIFLPVMLFFTIWGARQFFKNETHSLEFGLFAILSFSILFLAVMMRQHYALGNQNRIIRLEFRLRYFQLFGQVADEAEAKLSFGQIAALRFAPDEEFKELLLATLAENLGSNTIKRSIKNWKPDLMRV